jgi:PRTRC genetic system protein A
MNLFPIIEGMPNKKFGGITYSLCSNGIFECRSLPGGGVVSTKVDGIKGLPEGKEEIRFLSKKVPISIYYEIIRFFREVERINNTNLESYAEIGYNPATESYFVYVPEQFVGPASVKYEINDFIKDNPGCWIVANFHSHPNFGAYFSGTDDKNDVRDQFSGVVGHINKAIPDISLRFAVGSKHIPMTMEDLFCADSCESTLNVTEAVKRVKFLKAVSQVSNQGYVPGGYYHFDGGGQSHDHRDWLRKGNSVYRSSTKKDVLDMVKNGVAKGFSIGELMGADW